MADTTFNFGMHAGKTFQHVFDNDKWYVSWAFKQDSSGSIKCKNGLLKRFIDFCHTASDPGSSASASVAAASGPVAATPMSQQATPSECAKVPSHMMAAHPMMAPTPMTAAQHHMAPQHQTMAPQHQMMAPQHQMMAPQYQTMAPQYQTMTPQQHMMASQQHYQMQAQAMLAPCAPMKEAEEKGPRSDPTWCQVLDHLDERGIDFETVRDAHRDTRRDILKAVFYGDPILRAQAETMWLKLQQEKAPQSQARGRSRSRGKKLHFTPCTISTGVAPSISAAF